jgi:hypothetical protein
MLNVMVDNTIAIATIASTIPAAAAWIADISFFQHHGRRCESCGSGGSGDGNNLVASSHDANTT